MLGAKETVNQAIAGNRVSIQSLVADLGNSNGRMRIQARETLVRIGSQAVEPLMLALKDRNWHVRWEAAKALGGIGDPKAAPALVDM